MAKKTVEVTPVVEEAADKKTFGKAQLGRAVSELVGITIPAAMDVVTCVFDEILEAVQQGETVSIAKFGSFSAVTVAAHTGRNPATGESIEVPEKRKLKFKPSSTTKVALN